MNHVAILIFIVSFPVLAQDHIVGLVEIPELHGELNEQANDRLLGSVTLYSEPSTDSDVALVIVDRHQLVSREHGYEQVSAVVYDTVRGAGGISWYQLRSSDANNSVFAWLRGREEDQFRSALSLVASIGLNHLTEAWDGRLYEQQHPDSQTKLFSERTQYQDIRILDTYSRDVTAGENWYLVVLVRGNCTADPIEVIDYGWVPEYAESGGNTVWYYSRGC